MKIKHVNQRDNIWGKKKMKDQTRNLNPTKEAILAMNLYSKEYSEQLGGSMDFWDKLSENKRQRCIELLNRLTKGETT